MPEHVLLADLRRAMECRDTVANPQAQRWPSLLANEGRKAADIAVAVLPQAIASDKALDFVIDGLENEDSLCAWCQMRPDCQDSIKSGSRQACFKTALLNRMRREAGLDDA